MTLMQRLLEVQAQQLIEDEDAIGSEAQMVGEDLFRMEQTAEQLCGMGYRVAVMTTIENIIRNCKLDRFGK